MSLQRPKCPASLRPRLLLRCAIAALGLAGIGTSQAAGDYPLIGQPAPDFALHALVGGNVRLSEHRGEVVVISFWRSSCSACRGQLAALDRSLDTYHAAGLSMYGINIDGNPRRARRAAGNLAFALLLDPQRLVSRKYDIDYLPTTVLIDRSGTVRYALRNFNAKSEARYLQQLRALLDE